MATATPGWASTTPTTIRPNPVSTMAVAPSAPYDFGILVLMAPSSVEAEDKLSHAAHCHVDEKL